MDINNGNILSAIKDISVCDIKVTCSSSFKTDKVIKNNSKVDVLINGNYTVDLPDYFLYAVYDLDSESFEYTPKIAIPGKHVFSGPKRIYAIPLCKEISITTNLNK